MRKIFFLVSIILIFAACGTSTFDDEELQNEIAMLRTFNTTLQEQIMETEAQIDTLTDIIAEFGQSHQPIPSWWLGIDQAEFRQSIVDDEEYLIAAINAAFGTRMADLPSDFEMTFLPLGAVIEVHFEHNPPGWAFAYLNFNRWGTGDAHRWILTAIDSYRLFVATDSFTPRGIYQQINNGEHFYMRLYSVNTYREWFYDEIQICGISWAEQVIEAMPLQIRDLWFEGSRLFVDLMPDAAYHVGYTHFGSYYSENRLLHSLASLPGVEEIEILFGGHRGIIVGSNISADFGGVYAVSGLERISE